MDDVTIDKIGEAAFGSQWGGVFASDNAGTLLKSHGPRYAIVNTATSQGRGSHWMGVYIGAGRRGYPPPAWLYDSFGREPQQVSWRFNRVALQAHVALHSTDSAAEQRGTSSVCGQLSLAWLLTVQELGITAVAAAV